MTTKLSFSRIVAIILCSPLIVFVLVMLAPYFLIAGLYGAIEWVFDTAFDIKPRNYFDD